MVRPPTHAGKNIANPTAVLLSGTMMLRKLGEFDSARLIENALFTTMEAGKLTQDLDKSSKNALGTREFTSAIIDNLGKNPSNVDNRDYKKINMPELPNKNPFVSVGKSQLVGVDIFVNSTDNVDEIGNRIESAGLDIKLHMISSRGLKVYPSIGAEFDPGDLWQCRFLSDNTNDDQVNSVIASIEKLGLSWVHIEKLFSYDGNDAFSKAQGED